MVIYNQILAKGVENIKKIIDDNTVGDMFLEFKEIEELKRAESKDENLYAYTKVGPVLTILCC